MIVVIKSSYFFDRSGHFQYLMVRIEVGGIARKATSYKTREASTEEKPKLEYSTTKLH